MKYRIRLLALALVSALLLPTLAACGGGTATTETTAAEGEATSTPTEAPTDPVTDVPTDPAETDPEDKPWEPPVETTLGLANVAVGCPVITNACEEGSNQNLTDGNPDTDYNSGMKRGDENRTFPFEVVIDLTRTYPLAGLVIHKAARSGSLFKKAIYDKFRVEVSEDGLTYTEVATEATVKATGDGLELPLDTTARFVRITSTDLGDRGSYGLCLSEIEVLSTITNADNLLPNKRALVMRPGATDLLTATYRLPVQEDTALSSLRFISSDPSVVKVDETIVGAITAVADGEAIIYVTDGQNATPIPVTVHTPDPAYRVATFYLADHGVNSREVFALLKESGITYIENCRPYDTFGNLTTEYLRVQAYDYGLTLSVSDPAHYNFLRMSDEEIRAVAAKYKNLPGYGGLYILDEPANANPYARVYRALMEEDPFCIPHLNLLPGGMSDFHGYVSDWVATTGGDVLKSLSYDNYPYTTAPNSFNTLVYQTLNEIRTTALLYHDLNTGYYIHSMGIHNAYRVPTDAEIYYHTALGVAYGMKDFKHFVWFTPPYSGSGEHFITGVLNPEYGKSEIFEGVKAANTMLHALSPYLANTDAVELYHTRGQDGTAIPADFCVAQDSNTPIVLSVLVDRDTGRQYLAIVNKRFNKEATVELKIKDSALTDMWNVVTGEAVPASVSGGKLTLELPAGGLAVLMLPEGYDARADKTVNDGTEKSLLSGIGASVSSSVGAGSFAYMLNDGKYTTGWSNNDTADTAWIVYDLKDEKTFNRVDIYPVEGEEAFFPRAISVWVSQDGKNYTEVAAAKDIDLSKWGSLTFEATTARYIRISLDQMINLGAPSARIGEIEVYMDNGQLPAMPAMKVNATLPTEGSLIKGAPFITSSSYEEWGWTNAVINDGRIDYVEGVHQGWCSAIGSQVPESNEWVAFVLPAPATLHKMVIHPVSTFVKAYHVEVSSNGVDWETVASVDNDKYTDKTPRTLEFEAENVKYLRLVITEMGVKSTIYEVGYVVQIAEIEVY